MIPPENAANLVEVAIPSGGRAWVRRRITVGMSLVRNGAKVRLARYLPPELAAESDLTDEQAFAAMVGRDDTGEIIRVLGEAKIETVAACAWGWDGVRGPDGDELAFPRDVVAMDAADLEALYAAQEAAIESADPNDGRGPSRRRSPEPAPTPPGPPTSTPPG